jgi:hypothetical protein
VLRSFTACVGGLGTQLYHPERMYNL